MYIAFKWLLVLSLSMWLSLIWAEHNKNDYKRRIEIALLDRDVKNTKERPKIFGENGFWLIMLFNSTVLAFGVIIVTVYSNKEQIAMFCENRIKKCRQKVFTKKSFRAIIDCCTKKSKSLMEILHPFCITAKRVLQQLKQQVSELVTRIKDKLNEDKHNDLNEMLVKKLVRLKEERNKMVHVLMAAVETNRSIKKQYRLGSTAKNKLVEYMEESYHQMKENIAMYVNFRSLYTICHQENLLLKSHLSRAITERENAKYHLKLLIQEVYKTNDYKLKIFCTQFWRYYEDRNVSNEMEIYFKKFDRAGSSKEQLNEFASGLPLSRKSASTTDEITFNDDQGFVLNKKSTRDAPKNYRYIWTVQNKHGLIENVYEYFDGLDLKRRENVKRIRQYSVFHEKDCVIDLSNNSSRFESRSESPAIEFPRDPKFLTNSKAFQNFLKTYDKSIAVAPQRKYL